MTPRGSWTTTAVSATPRDPAGQRAGGEFEAPVAGLRPVADVDDRTAEDHALGVGQTGTPGPVRTGPKAYQDGRAQDGSRGQERLQDAAALGAPRVYSSRNTVIDGLRTMRNRVQGSAPSRGAPKVELRQGHMSKTAQGAP